MNMKVITIIIFVLETIPKRLVKGLEDLDIGRQKENTHITALLRLARILKRGLET